MSEKLLTIIIGKNIVSRRKKLNISQKELAAKLSISYESLGRIERGKMAPKFGRLQDIAFCLQCTVASLFVEPDNIEEKRNKFIEELFLSLSKKEQEALKDVILSTVRAMNVNKN